MATTKGKSQRGQSKVSPRDGYRRTNVQSNAAFSNHKLPPDEVHTHDPEGIEVIANQFHIETLFKVHYD
jgi:hypothetical protein